MFLIDVNWKKATHVLTLLTRRDTLRCHFIWLKEYLAVNVIVQCVFNRWLLLINEITLNVIVYL